MPGLGYFQVLKQIRMRTRPEEKQLQLFLLDPVHKQPVRLDMAFPEAGIVASQLMVPVLGIQLFSGS